MNTNKESWESEFDELTLHTERCFIQGESIQVNAEHLGDVKYKLLPKIKQFIKTQRTQAKEEERKRIEEGVKQLPVYDYTHSFVHGSGTKALQLFERVQTNKTAEVLKIINKTNE